MTFKQQLLNAAIKLQRATQAEDNIDPVSCFSADEVADWIATHPATFDEQDAARARAVLRRYGYASLAATI